MFFVAAFCILAMVSTTTADEPTTKPPPSIRAALIKTSDASKTRLEELKSSGTNTIVFPLNSSDDQTKVAIRLACETVEQEGLSLGYWIEVARSPELADEHPEWMASLQTHEEWRRFFPNAPKPQSDEVVKTYPWVPILSRKPFDAQLKRVRSSISGLPTAKYVFLNDLQGAPSACGCGSPLCRWTSDYGDRRTTVPLGDDAAALFLSKIQSDSPDSEIVPVWTTECEEHDGSHDGLCAGVGCFKGICWKAYTRQLMPVSKASKRVAVLALYKEFQRDLPIYGTAEASWVNYAIRTFQTMPPQQGGEPIAASRMIAVLQGWDTSKTEIEAQQNIATTAGASGYVTAYDKIEQSWAPKIARWK